ncbi:MAG: hypothetical protein H6702_17990 [Myxococcales bacterium]|nr:hypothetical protein [Myxococcales bacterium]
MLHTLIALAGLAQVVAPTTPAAVPDAALVITEPATLVALEAAGLDLGGVLGGDGADAAALFASSPAYRDLVTLLSKDQDLLAARDPRSGVGFGHAHRAFDVGWLKDARARFELVAVVNRLDRKHVRAGGCGERRLIYRLAYTAGAAASRLPMTLNVVLPQDPAPGEAGCAGVAARWLAVEGAPDRAQALLSGPLAAPRTVERVETNLQSVRIPSGVRPDLGGHAGYVLRVFRAQPGPDGRPARLQVGTLENTPTVTLDGARREALRRYLRARPGEIDSGLLVLPDEFLARRSVSVAPRGVPRAANRPYRKVLGPANRLFRKVKFEGELVRSAAGALRRLETMSCKGCHQSGSLAGFHLLGEAQDPQGRWNEVAVPFSRHLQGELGWRRGFLEATARGEAYAVPRPFAERTGGGAMGAPCGLGDDPTFKTWGCDAGLVCHDTLGDALGVCGHAAPVPPGGLTEQATLVPSKSKAPDRVRLRDRLACAGPDPEGATSGNGFPGGMCHAPCDAYGARQGDAVCGPVPFDGGALFGGFTHCLARLGKPFAACIADSSRPTWLAHCDRANPCREDYLCARVPGLPGDEGACLPTYFLAQIRVDGHALADR